MKNLVQHGVVKDNVFSMAVSKTLKSHGGSIGELIFGGVAKHAGAVEYVPAVTSNGLWEVEMYGISIGADKFDSDASIFSMYVTL
jgi:hypothetical protein